VRLPSSSVAALQRPLLPGPQPPVPLKSDAPVRQPSSVLRDWMGRPEPRFRLAGACGKQGRQNQPLSAPA